MKFSHIILTIIAFAALQACEPRKDTQVTELPAAMVVDSVKSDTISNVNPDSICIAAVGDMMLGTSYPNKNTLPPDSAKYALTMVELYLKNADLTFGNLEGTLIDTAAPAYYKLHFKSKGYLFRSPVKYAGVLKNAGFDVLSIANNHIDDFGLPGRLSTMRTLDSIGIYYAGLLSRPSVKFTLKGIRYGFCAFAPNSQTSSLLNLKRAAKIIRELKDSSDIVIVSFHGGGEGVDFEHVTCQPETYFGENRGNVNAFAHNAIDSGADLVFGHGPHVTRAMELYHGRFIAYSLGNFCTYRSVSIAGICGIAPLLRVNVNKKGEFLSGNMVSIRQSHLTGVQVDTLHRAAKKVRQLTGIDFPQSGLKISETGAIAKADTARTDI